MGDNVKRLRTWIPGLDGMTGGGIPEQHQVLLAGGPGTGKSLMSFEIAYRNAKAGVPSTFISIDESRERFLKNAKDAFRYFDDIDRLMERNLLIVESREMDTPFESTEAFITFLVGINDVLGNNSSKLLVMDSLSPLRFIEKDDREFTRHLNVITENFRKIGVTAVFTIGMTKADLSDGLLTFGVFMMDGVLQLMRDPEVTRQNQLRVIKLRDSQFSKDTMPYELTENGYSVFK